MTTPVFPGVEAANKYNPEPPKAETEKVMSYPKLPGIS